MVLAHRALLFLTIIETEKKLGVLCLGAHALSEIESDLLPISWAVARLWASIGK